ncbi:hypothetical protein PFISCL1PPCAC_8469 [Pristionchus fissidentatus]|uniref:PDZ domain-containing protein n=1 Tax=Pristionchus fissidentatus TaxID=1538716 RepID=A0AAV5VGA7_9BILA|nr:hypothetical protein PFISCL1PPCAC_8469 [Pristionchus fissidentatus]
MAHLGSYPSSSEEDVFELVDDAISVTTSIESCVEVVDEVGNKKSKQANKEGMSIAASTAAAATSVTSAAAASTVVATTAAAAAHHSLLTSADVVDKCSEKPSDGGNEICIDLKTNRKIPPPRLIRIELNKKDNETGIGIYSRGRNYHFVGTLRLGSAADRAGLRIGDRIYFINGITTKGLRDAGVVDLLIAARKTIDVLILPKDAAKMYKSLGIPVSLALPNIVREGASESATDALSAIPLAWRNPLSFDYGFSVAPFGRARVNKVDINTAVYRHGLREGARIAGVGDLLFHSSMSHWKVEEMLRQQPEHSSLWIAPKKERIVTELDSIYCTVFWLVFSVIFDIIFTGMQLVYELGADHWGFGFYFSLVSAFTAIFIVPTFERFPPVILAKLACSLISICYVVGCMSGGAGAVLMVVSRLSIMVSDVICTFEFISARRIWLHFLSRLRF